MEFRLHLPAALVPAAELAIAPALALVADKVAGLVRAEAVTPEVAT